MAKLTKRMKTAQAAVQPGKVYALDEALKIIKDNAKAKFVESVDVAVRLGIDAKKSDQGVRGSSLLPHGTGKTVKVAVFCPPGEKAEAAKAAGADAVGMQAQRFEIAPEQAHPGIQAGAHQQQDAEVGGEGHVRGHLHGPRQAQVQPATIDPLDGKQDLLVLIAHDEAIGLHGRLFLPIERGRTVEQGQGDAVVGLPLPQALTLLARVQARKAAAQGVHLPAHLLDENAILHGRVDAIQDVVEEEHRGQEAGTGHEPQPQEQPLHSDQAAGLNW